jgi:alpha-L-arabinofuranosidase
MQQQLEHMSVKEIDRKATEKKIMANEARRVRRATQAAAKAALNGDRMQASKGVRTVMYKTIQGFNTNILQLRGGVEVEGNEYNRQGNRYRSERSKLLASYWGKSRSFVLRIQEHGTVTRTAGIKYSSRGGSGNRGMILAKDFMATARTETQAAADNVVRQLSFIDQLFMQ